MAIAGVDPGWASFGIAIEDRGKTLFKASYVPRDYGGTILGFINHLEHELPKISIPDVYIERFVAYKGIHSDASESILMLIGALNYYFENLGSKVHMVRAIDWKPKVCKYLVRTQGFNNEFPSFDKRYSLLAAKTLSGQELKVDHEADAICLSYLGIIDEFNTTKGKAK